MDREPVIDVAVFDFLDSVQEFAHGPGEAPLQVQSDQPAEDECKHECGG